MDFLKKIIKNVLSFLGYKIVAISSTYKEDIESQPSFIDGFLSCYIRNGRNISIIQCGANDGITVDPVNSFIDRNIDFIQAILIEPLPDVFESLERKYLINKNIITMNIAVGPYKTIDLYRIRKEYINLYSGIIASGITSFNRDYVLKKATEMLDLPSISPDKRIERVTQICKNLSTIIDENIFEDQNNIFIQVDAEGFDDKIIYSIDFERHHPIAINYEFTHLSHSAHLELKDFLESKGYYFIMWSKSDEIAISKKI